MAFQMKLTNCSAIGLVEVSAQVRRTSKNLNLGPE
jgi:hypothetical protein